MIERLKNYLLSENIEAVWRKLYDETATEQDVANLDRMESYTERGYW